MISELKNSKASISVYNDSFNKRIRVDDYTGDANSVLELIDQAAQNWVEKVIIKARGPEQQIFQSQGFSKEAFVKGYFDGTDMHFMAKYFSSSRSHNSKQGDEKVMLEKLLMEEIPASVSDFSIVTEATIGDADELTRLYSTVFKVYPTPLGEPGHVRKTMEEGTRYVLIRNENKIVSAASAEINSYYSNAELTDCATLPEAEGKGHMKKLLSKLEAGLKKDKINCLYTIARSESYSMNKVFYQLGYTYGGMMTNNCFIYSGLEDMNVWYKWIGE
ncbi:MAG TPA: putative beta-lysine N-acetyltransferase [Chryseolinea sp.]